MNRKLSGTSHYDFEAVHKRIRQAEMNRNQMRPFYSGRSKLRPSDVAWTPWTPRRVFLIAASLVVLAFVCWLCSSVQAFYAQSQEGLLAAACQNNQLHHAGAAYCFDGGHLVHTLNADGTVRSPGFDWRVNETALRQAEAAETARVGPRRHAKLAE